LCSRRKADELIADGVVTIDEQTAQPGVRVMDGQVVKVRGVPVLPDQDYLYIALHKPLGVTCTTDTSDPDNVIDYLGFEKRVFPIGRLDKTSTGLLLLTNDGSIVNRLLRAEGKHEKEYHVEVDKPVTDEFIHSMASGVPILETITLPCKIQLEDARSFRITLTQGLNRQIRRMCEYHGYRVRKLQRTRILNIDLKKLPIGQWRLLTNKEMRDLRSLIDIPSNVRKQMNHNTCDS
jgi:23S rRNA pseudouridine2604 synthase